MANEVTGKTLKYFQNSVEQAVKSVNFDNNFTMLDSTSTAVASPGMESVPGRAKRTLKVEADLLTALGSELATGSTVVGTKYLVTMGPIDDVEATHAAGTIYTATTNATLDSTHKVKVLGSKITGKTLAVTIGGSSFAATNASYDVKYSELDSTTTATTTPGTEVVTGRAKVTSKFDALMYRATAEKLLNAAPTAVAIVITFDSGITVTGNGIIHQESISNEVNGICKVSYTVEWQGMPTEVGIGYLTMATQQTFSVVYETGSSTNKEITGNVIMTDKSVSSDVSGDTKISYSGHVNGTITLNNYA